MKVIDRINEASETIFSFEILPPVKGANIKDLYEAIDPLMEMKPQYVNVTYHREEFIYKERENGLLEKMAIRKRPGTVGICAALMNKYNVSAVPHLICGGFSVEETENALIDLNFLGINNVLALRGDAIKTEVNFKPHPEGHNYAVELVEQINKMNQGIYREEEVALQGTDFCIGVAGYPEKHFEAMNLDEDILNLKRKIDAGAQYVVTQMFFDNQKFFDYVDKCRKAGISVPIIPGIKPIKNLKHKSFLPKFFHVDYPEALAKELIKCKNNSDVEKLGIEWGIAQCKELKANGVPGIHFYTMGKSEDVKQIASQIF